jgi:hypothetical protein
MWDYPLCICDSVANCQVHLPQVPNYGLFSSSIAEKKAPITDDYGRIRHSRFLWRFYILCRKPCTTFAKLQRSVNLNFEQGCRIATRPHPWTKQGVDTWLTSVKRDFDFNSFKLLIYDYYEGEDVRLITWSPEQHRTFRLRFIHVFGTLTRLFPVVT